MSKQALDAICKNSEVSENTVIKVLAAMAPLDVPAVAGAISLAIKIQYPETIEKTVKEASKNLIEGTPPTTSTRSTKSTTTKST